MTLPLLAFYGFSFLLLVSALSVVFARNAVHSVLFLIMAFFNAAGLLILLGAEFLAMILLIVYIGAVAVLFLFVVMTLDIDADALGPRVTRYMPLGLFLGGVLLAELLLILSGQLTGAASSALAPPAVPISSQPNSEALGAVLYTRYVHFFQLAGLILLTAMIGAIVLTLRVRRDIKKQDPSMQVMRRPEESIEIRKVPPGRGV